MSASGELLLMGVLLMIFRTSCLQNLFSSDASFL
jgi:hypothetical protein